MADKNPPEVGAIHQIVEAPQTSLPAPILPSPKPQPPPKPAQFKSGQVSNSSSTDSKPRLSNATSDDKAEKKATNDVVQIQATAAATAAKPLQKLFKFPPLLDREVLKSLSISPEAAAIDQRWYVGLSNLQKSYGIFAKLSRFRPEVEHGGMSLIQTSVFNIEPGHPMQTIESGWQRFGDSGIPRFFIYYTTTGYDQEGPGYGGYAEPNADNDADTKDWTRLKKFDPYAFPACHIDGEQLTMNVKWQLITNIPGLPDGWYLGLNGEWIGCYKLDLFRAKPPNTINGPNAGKVWPLPEPSTTLADHASHIQVYGEVFDPDFDRHSSDPKKLIPTSTDMGSGKRAESGWAKSAFISNVMRLPNPSSVSTNWEEAADNWILKKDESVVPAMYDLIYVPLSPTILRSFCFLGGTGAPLASGTWSEWDNVSGVKDVIFNPSPDTRITVLERNTSRLDLFVVGKDGKVYTSFWSDDDWSGFNKIGEWRMLDWGSSKTPIFPAGSKITAVARSENNMDLFGVANDGKVWNAWWIQGQDWDGWRQISGDQNFTPGAPMAAVSRFAGRHDIFVNGGGTIRAASWTQSDAGVVTDWTASPWPSIGDSFPSTAQILALSRSNESMEVFVTGTDGHVYGNAFFSISLIFTIGFWTGFGDIGTSAPDPTTDPPSKTRFLAGTKIAGVTRGSDRMELFVVGPDNNLWFTHWDTDTQWAGAGAGKSWESLGNQSAFDSTKSDVVAITRAAGFGTNTVDVFVTGIDGLIYRTGWNDARNTWTSVGPLGGGWDVGVGGVTNQDNRNMPGFTIAAASRTRDMLTVLAVDAFGVVKVTGYQGP
jgi:hypothetical protein